MFIKKLIFVCLSLLFLLIVFRGNVYASTSYACNTPSCTNPVTSFAFCGHATCPYDCGESGDATWSSVGSAIACGSLPDHYVWCCSWSTTCCTYCNPGDCGTCEAAGTCDVCRTSASTVPDGKCGTNSCPKNCKTSCDGNTCCKAAKSCPTTCHTNTVTVDDGDCTTTDCPPNAPVKKSCPTTCHTNTVTVDDGDCTTTDCPPNAPAAGTCPVCRMSASTVDNGSCGKTTCAINCNTKCVGGVCCDPKEFCADLACHTSIVAVENGDCTTRDCPPNAPPKEFCSDLGCHTDIVKVENGNCTKRDCPPNAPAAGTCPTTTNCNYAGGTVPDGACGNTICYPGSCPVGYTCNADGTCDGCPPAQSCATCRTVASPVPNGLCGERPCLPNCNRTCVGGVCCAAAQSCPVCRTSASTVDDGSCGNTPCAINCTTNCIGNICCTPTAPEKPTLASPADAVEIALDSNVTMDWNDIVSWGYACPTNDNHYNICVSTVSGSCNLEDTRTDMASQATRPATIAGWIYWAAKANNGGTKIKSSQRSFCVEGFNVADTNYVSTWSVCGADHKRTKTCTEDCGVNDCASVSLSEDCIGTITGTLFDASEVGSCADMASAPKYEGVAIDIIPDVAGKWSVINAPVTGGGGVYSANVYAPATYSIDFTNFLASGMASGIRFYCDGSNTNIPIISQAQVVSRSFGFWRTFGGWWQAKGGNVYAKSGMRSYIPTTVSPVSNQKLILEDANGRSGVLSYGGGTVYLGTNLSATIGAPWMQSLYGGLHFDYNYYKTRMDVFPSTAWAGSVNYNGGGKGYQIYKANSEITLINLTLLPSEKVIILVDGSVNVTGNLVVPPTAFLSVIAKGDITFSDVVTSAQGWFVAENINVPCKDTAVPLGTCDKTDDPFDGQGSFVGWAGINLGRDMGVTNNTTPAEKFTYRKDMFINAPAPMKIYTKSFSPFIP